MKTFVKTYALSLLIATLIVVFVFLVAKVLAQPVHVCNLAPIRQMLNISIEAIDADDHDITLETLAELEWMIGQVRAECAGLSFSSQANGSQPVLPITLEVGMWIATAETNGLFATSTTLIDGECDLSYGTIGTIYPGGGMMQTVIESDGCTFLLEISSSVDPWMLRFERIP